ncbi:MAG TPA: PTS sugar transporter subunit IIA [Chthoniobacterales bacterium]|nr:PTS sugar transporter subunit IIA [Chthoniobacterales bacterium]
MAIALADLLDTRQVTLTLRSRTAENAIHELVGLLAANEQLTAPEKFAEQIIARERANPSIVEAGVVFPHARSDLAEKIVLAIGRKTAGIPFGEQSARANLIFLIGVPQRLVNDYLICVGALARIARNDEIRSELMRVNTPEKFIELLTAASSPEGSI